MKKIVKIAIVTFLLIGNAWFVYKYYIQAQRKKSVNSIQLEQNPILPDTNKVKIYLNLAKEQFGYVDTLPLLQITKKTFSQENLNTIAGHLGFSRSPIEMNDALEGVTNFWRNDQATLFAYAGSSKLRYSALGSATTTDNQLSDDAIKSIALRVLIDSGMLTQESFTFGDIEFLKAGSVSEAFMNSTRDDFSVYQINIFPKSTEYEIISTTSTNNMNYIQITKDGNIYAFQITVFDSVQKGQTEYTMKTYDEVNNSLKDAVLIRLGDDVLLVKDLPDMVKQIAINKIDIAYLFDSFTAATLRPVYKLTGTATLINGSTTEAIFYLPALSDFK